VVSVEVEVGVVSVEEVVGVVSVEEVVGVVSVEEVVGVVSVEVEVGVVSSSSIRRIWQRTSLEARATLAPTPTALSGSTPMCVAARPTVVPRPVETAKTMR
ncbi:hypothetical protein, partial [Streptomyces nigra]|uniref:hypothetical protein n=1 Tax=Streptomyces nigra TaxID=1827580 RepID=UPI00381A4C62